MLDQTPPILEKNEMLLGFYIKPGTHPIVPVMLYDAVLSQKMAEKLLEKGIYVIGFYYPVVPKGTSENPSSDLSTDMIEA